MKVAVFLDVDNTLTVGYIQAHFAELLKCGDQYRKIEDDFQNEKIPSAEFGNRLVKLFAEAGFTKDFAQKNFDKIKLQPWAKRLLSESVDIFLVSSGPNYYIDFLADHFEIPKSNVCNSVYHFDGVLNVISGCDPISNASKAEFVSRKSKDYDFTIGVGDSEIMDGPFVANCTLGLLTVQTDGYLYLPSFEILIKLIHAIEEYSKLCAVIEKAVPENLVKLAPEDLAKLSIKELLGSLNIGQLWLVLGAAVAVVSFCAVGGYYTRPLIDALNAAPLLQ